MDKKDERPLPTPEEAAAADALAREFLAQISAVPANERKVLTSDKFTKDYIMGWAVEMVELHSPDITRVDQYACNCGHVYGAEGVDGHKVQALADAGLLRAEVTGEMVERTARAIWERDNAEGTTAEWRDMAWRDMGGSEPAEERVEYLLRARALAAAGLLATPSVVMDELRIDQDWLHIYWRDPVEGCWVAYRRVDCVGEEELPAGALTAALGAGS